MSRPCRTKTFTPECRESVLKKARALLPYGFTPLGAVMASLHYLGPFRDRTHHATISDTQRGLAPELVMEVSSGD